MAANLNIVAANFQNEFLQIKTMLLQIKTSKCARALKEGGVGTRSFIFLSGKLLYFFLGLCDYSEKIPKMLCSSQCGMECPSSANFCHQSVLGPVSQKSRELFGPKSQLSNLNLLGLKS